MKGVDAGSLDGPNLAEVMPLKQTETKPLSIAVWKVVALLYPDVSTHRLTVLHRYAAYLLVPEGDLTQRTSKSHINHRRCELSPPPLGPLQGHCRGRFRHIAPFGHSCLPSRAVPPVVEGPLVLPTDALLPSRCWAKGLRGQSLLQLRSLDEGVSRLLSIPQADSGYFNFVPWIFSRARCLPWNR